MTYKQQCQYERLRAAVKSAYESWQAGGSAEGWCKANAKLDAFVERYM